MKKPTIQPSEMRDERGEKAVQASRIDLKMMSTLFFEEIEFQFAQ